MKVIDIINRHLESRKPDRPLVKRSYFYISEAGKTPYQIFKSMTKTEKLTPRMKRVFDNGDHVHDRIRDYLKQMGVVRGIEVQLRSKLFHGRADAILFENGEIAVLEIKSMNKAGFQRLKKYGTRQAYLQLQLYMHFLKIDQGIILIECKDDQRLKEFRIKRKPRVAQERIQYFSRLKTKLVRSGVMAS